MAEADAVVDGPQSPRHYHFTDRATSRGKGRDDGKVFRDEEHLPAYRCTHCMMMRTDEATERPISRESLASSRRQAVEDPSTCPTFFWLLERLRQPTVPGKAAGPLPPPVCAGPYPLFVPETITFTKGRPKNVYYCDRHGHLRVLRQASRLQFTDLPKLFGRIARVRRQMPAQLPLGCELEEDREETFGWGGAVTLDMIDLGKTLRSFFGGDEPRNQANSAPQTAPGSPQMRLSRQNSPKIKAQAAKPATHPQASSGSLKLPRNMLLMRAAKPLRGGSVEEGKENQEWVGTRRSSAAYSVTDSKEEVAMIHFEDGATKVMTEGELTRACSTARAQNSTIPWSDVSHIQAIVAPPKESRSIVYEYNAWRKPSAGPPAWVREHDFSRIPPPKEERGDAFQVVDVKNIVSSIPLSINHFLTMHFAVELHKGVFEFVRDRHSTYWLIGAKKLRIGKFFERPAASAAVTPDRMPILIRYYSEDALLRASMSPTSGARFEKMQARMLGHYQGIKDKLSIDSLLIREYEDPQVAIPAFEATDLTALKKHLRAYTSPREDVASPPPYQPFQSEERRFRPSVHPPSPTPFDSPRRRAIHEALQWASGQGRLMAYEKQGFVKRRVPSESQTEVVGRPYKMYKRRGGELCFPSSGHMYPFRPAPAQPATREERPSVSERKMDLGVDLWLPESSRPQDFVPQLRLRVVEVPRHRFRPSVPDSPPKLRRPVSYGTGVHVFPAAADGWVRRERVQRRSIGDIRRETAMMLEDLNGR
ncbi:unnamed protein product [Vitrella brassicaformis CCMP3155]|uniref:Uncharacterized protein n=2 Tax=Vitrella brassicaformis TaxID=1169539 RepID=A0A0G4GK51_VITBC|nr:unnamed protein product [Vitrella brassicaformis CCMP3155]|eukprot:CEM30309.1 unnamed protein product [Vitrella brassicaformis CCMP3155]